MTIKVKDIINKPIAISTEDGEKLRKEIINELSKNSGKIEISFKEINMLISHFLNESIGKLYTIYKKQDWEILDKIKYTGINNSDLNLLQKRVIPNYKRSLSDRERFENIQENILK